MKHFLPSITCWGVVKHFLPSFHKVFLGLFGCMKTRKHKSKLAPLRVGGGWEPSAARHVHQLYVLCLNCHTSSAKLTLQNRTCTIITQRQRNAYWIHKERQGGVGVGVVPPSSNINPMHNIERNLKKKNSR